MVPPCRGRPAPEEEPETPAFDPKAGIKLQRKLREILTLEQKLADGDCLTGRSEAQIGGEGESANASCSNFRRQHQMAIAYRPVQCLRWNRSPRLFLRLESRRSLLRLGQLGSYITVQMGRWVLPPVTGVRNVALAKVLHMNLLQEPRDVTSRAPRRWERRGCSGKT